MTATATVDLERVGIISIDSHHFNRYTYIDDHRSGTLAEDQAARRRPLLRAGRLSRRRTPAGRAHGDHRESARRSRPVPARRRPPQARGQGLRVRAGPAVRDLPAHPLAPPQEAARGRHRRLRAPRPLGLLLRPPRSPPGALRMAEVTDCCTPAAQATCCEPSDKAACCDTSAEGGRCGCSAGASVGSRESVRERYAAAARTATMALPAADEAGRFGATLYGDEADVAPPAAVAASLG